MTPKIRPLRPAAPGFAGPLAESGAAPTGVPDPPKSTDGPPATARPEPAGTGARPEPAEAAVHPEPARADTAPAATDAASDTTDTPAATDAASAAPAAVPAGTDSAPAGAGPVPESTAPAETPPPDPTPDQPAGEEGHSGKANGKAGDADERAGAPTRRRRVRVPFGRARPMPGPREVAARSGRLVARSARAVRTWSGRPSGRLVLPGLLLLGLVAAATTAGAVLIPATAPAPRAAATGASAPASGEPTQVAVLPPVVPGQELAPTAFPTGEPAGGPPPGLIGGRPADVLAGWAQQTSARVDVPPVAMQAYGYAELVLAQTTPNCHLTWTTLAAIGHVESNHGSANDATLGPDGQAVPHIIGLPLDGKGGRQRITDTDGGQLDNDPVYDRAVGPMQFIPSTWREQGVDADNDGVKNPHDIDDAALAAGNYLCANGRDLATSEGWWNAILSYNDVRRYAQAVFDAADRYGAGSRA